MNPLLPPVLDCCAGTAGTVLGLPDALAAQAQTKIGRLWLCSRVMALLLCAVAPTKALMWAQVKDEEEKEEKEKKTKKVKEVPPRCSAQAAAALPSASR